MGSKIFGFCENKGKHEVYTKEQTDNLLAGKAASVHTHDDRYYTETEVNAKLADYKLKGDIATFAGEITINGSTSSSITINYPSGFTKDNSVLLSCGLVLKGDGNAKGYNYYGLFADTSDTLNNAYRRRINFTNDNIKLWVENPGTSILTLTYKIAVMKV